MAEIPWSEDQQAEIERLLREAEETRQEPLTQRKLRAIREKVEQKDEEPVDGA